MSNPFRTHRLLGVATVVLAVAHEAAVVIQRHGIKPFSPWGWLTERLLVGLMVLVPGLWMAVSTRRGARRSMWEPIASAVALGSVSFALFLRYFAPMPAVLAIAALADCLLLSRSLPRAVGRIVAIAAFMLALTGVAAFLGVSYLSAGA